MDYSLLCEEFDRQGTACITRRHKDSTLERLTELGPYRDWGPHPWPDGTILFKRDAIGHRGSLQAETWLMDPDGSNQRLWMKRGDHGLTDMGHQEYEPASDTIVFAGSEPGGTFSLYRSDLRGVNVERLTGGGSFEADPSGHPDGRVLFTRRPGGWGGLVSVNQEVWVSGHSGEAVTQERLTFDEEDGRSSRAEWDVFASPDGKRVIGLRQNDVLGFPFPPWDNFLMNDDGTGWRVVADGSAEGHPWTGFGVARWVTNSTVVSSWVYGWRAKGFGLCAYDVDEPGEIVRVLDANGRTSYRDPIPEIADD